MQQPHRQVVAAACAALEVVLCVQDSTQLDFSKRAARGSIDGAGPLGKKDGGGRGIVQHAALAITTTGQLLGVFDQQWHRPTRPPAGETRAQRRLRDTAAGYWAKAASAVSELATGACRVVHVGDRHSDMFSFFLKVRELGQGFLVRAMHNRYVALDDGNGDALDDAKDVGDGPGDSENVSVDAEVLRLQEALDRQPAAGSTTVDVPARSGSPREKRPARQAKVELRFVKVTLPPPREDPRFTTETEIAAWAVQVKEVDAAADVEPIFWTLLTSEPVASFDDAARMTAWYRRRWVIEEWHKVLKAGCRIEKAQFDHTDDIARLAAILGPVAADMLNLRELAEDPETADDPQALRRCVWDKLIAVVALINKVSPSTVTPRLLHRTMAKYGGHLFRKNDPRPGWQALWQGYLKLANMAAGYALAKEEKDV